MTTVDGRVVCPSCEALLAVPGSTKRPEPPDPLVGHKLGEFEMIRVVGRGGMGCVYEARQPSLDRRVAIKILPQDFSRDASFLERFRREARSAAAVSHPNIIEVYSVGEASGYQYIAMEFVDGEHLGDLIGREGRLEPSHALDIMQQVTAALAEAHGCGILHRDVKPSNILLTKKGRVKVADFGLAKRPEADVDVTGEGCPIGTPLYLPPEVARGNEADARSDLYSLGATFYHALAGCPPFEGSTPTEVTIQHVEKQVPPLQERAPHVPAALGRVIHRLLRKSPADRYGSATELLDALERIAGQLRPAKPGTAVAAKSRRSHAAARERTTSRAHKYRKTPRWRIAAIAAAAAAALLLVGLLVFGRRGGGSGPASQSDAGTNGAVAEAPQPGVAEPPPPPWEAAWKTGLAKADALAKEQRFGEAIRVVEAVLKDFDNPTLQHRVQWTTTRIREIADAATAAAERRARQLLEDEKFDEAREALRPVLEVFGIPAKAKQLEPLLTEIDVVAKPVASEDWRGEMLPLFDGKTLSGWRVVADGEFAEHGTVEVQDGAIALGQGRSLTGVASSGAFPTIDYEVSFYAMRAAGRGAFAEVVFPVRDARCVLVIGGSDSLLGLDAVDGEPWDKNVTTRKIGFENGRWYQVRLRVGAAAVEVWVSGERKVQVAVDGHRFTASPVFDPVQPFGLCASGAKAAIRDILLRRREAQPAQPAPARPEGEGWTCLFDGKSLDGWKPAEGEAFRGKDAVAAENGQIVLAAGTTAAGVLCTREVPLDDYEIAYEAMRVGAGEDFGSLVFPLGTQRGVLAIGRSAAGSAVGLELLDGRKADQNETTRQVAFELGHWYPVRLRVTREKIEATIANTTAIDLPRAGRVFGMPPAWDPIQPMGFLAVGARAAVRNVYVRPVVRELVRIALPPPDSVGWSRLFDGKTLGGWETLAAGGFAAHGTVEVKDGEILLGAGNPGTGIQWAGDFPKNYYEVELETMRISGNNHFGSMIFPVDLAQCSLIVDGFTGRVALSDVDGKSGSDNVTTTSKLKFENHRWYRIRLRVTAERVEALIDHEKIIDLPLAGHKLSLISEFRVIKGFGLSTWQSASAVRNIRLRLLPDPALVAQAEAEQKARIEKARQLEARLAKALGPAEALVAAWDFRGAADALAKVSLADKELAQRLAVRRDEAERLARLKAEIIGKINAAKPPLRKSALLISGINGDLVKADEKALSAALANGKKEAQEWASLGPRPVQRLAQLITDRNQADDWLAAGLLALVVRDTAEAQHCLEKARALGADIQPHLESMAAAALDEGGALLASGDFKEAEAVLAAAEKTCGDTLWLTAHRAGLDAARAKARAGLTEMKADKLYAQAVKLFRDEDLFALKPVVEQLRATYPTTRAVTDAARKPSFAELLQAVDGLGAFYSVRLDGKGDFKTVQDAVDAAVTNSVIEIQDEGPYDGRVALNDKALTIRGKEGLWPILTFTGQPRTNDVLFSGNAPRITLERLVIDGGNIPALNIASSEVRLRHVVLRAGSIVGGPAGSKTLVENCLFVQGAWRWCTESLTARNCTWLVGGKVSYEGIKTGEFDNCFVCGELASSQAQYQGFKVQSCTIVGKVFLAAGPNVLTDCVVSSVEARTPASQIDRCDVFGKQPFWDQAKAGKRCFSADPQFRDPKALDFRFKPGSPCYKRASDGFDLGCRYSREMLEMLKLAFDLRKKGALQF